MILIDESGKLDTIAMGLLKKPLAQNLTEIARQLPPLLEGDVL